MGQGGSSTASTQPLTGPLTPDFGNIVGTVKSPQCSALAQPFQYGIQPQVQLWQDAYCTGGTNVIDPVGGPNQYDDLYSLPNVGHNTITSMIIPPNVNLEVKDRYDSANVLWNNLSANKNQFWATRFGPGTYGTLDQQPVPSKCINCNQPDQNLNWNDRIYGAKATVTMPWNQFLTNCCLGKVSPSGQCQNFADPNGSDCQNLMLTQYCNNPVNFFSSDCKQYMQEASKKDARVNSVANAQCPSAKSQTDKDWCSCFDISTAPANLSAEAQAIWPCMQQACNDPTRSLQPFNKSCPSTLTICQQDNIKTELSQSTVGAQAIQNACGNINLGAPAPSPSSASKAPSPSIASAPATATGMSATTMGLIGGGIGLLLIIAIIIIIMMMKKKPVLPVQ